MKFVNEAFLHLWQCLLLLVLRLETLLLPQLPKLLHLY